MPASPSIRTCVAVAAGLLAGAAAPLGPEPPDPSLPAVVGGWKAPNPYRGSAVVLEAGRAAYAAHCASCHGADASHAVAEAPDLRRLNLFCLRLDEPALRSRCLADVDRYFLFSVRFGKRRAGLMHMPAFDGALPAETVWAIRTFIEMRPLPPRKTLPDLPPAGR